MRARSLGIVALVALPAACILDLDSLSRGTGGSASSSASSSSGGACALLDCGCIAEPAVIASGAPLAVEPRGIAVSAEGVTWASHAGSIVHAAASGETPAAIVSADQPVALAVAGGTVVWTEQDGVHACPLPSCSGPKLVTPSTMPGSIGALAFDGQTVAFSDRGTGASDGVVAACAIAGCAPITLGSSLIAPGAITFSTTHAFFVDVGTGDFNGTVSRVPKAGQGFMQIAAGLVLPSGIAADDTYVYWTEQKPGGRVLRCAFAGGFCDNPEEVAAGGFGRPRDIRVGGGRVYWTNRDDGSILSCPAPGCGSDAPKVHATGRVGLGDLALGSSCLFWTEESGAVMKAPR